MSCPDKTVYLYFNSYFIKKIDDNGCEYKGTSDTLPQYWSVWDLMVSKECKLSYMIWDKYNNCIFYFLWVNSSWCFLGG